MFFWQRQNLHVNAADIINVQPLSKVCKLQLIFVFDWKISDSHENVSRQIEYWEPLFQTANAKHCGCILQNRHFSFLIYIQGVSKRLTHFVSLYGLNSKRRLNTRQTVGCGIPSSLLALPVDLRGLLSKLSSIRLTFSDARGRPELLPLHRQPICSNWWFQRQMLFHRWRLNVETKTKRTLYSTRRLSFNELTNAKNLVLHSSHFVFNWRCCTAVH